MRIDLDAVAARLKALDERCQKSRRACAHHVELVGIALQLISENRLLREQLDLEERTHGCVSTFGDGTRVLLYGREAVIPLETKK